MKPLLSKPWPFLAEFKKRHPDAQVFVVGGALRDHFLGKPVKDFDLVICAVPIDDLISTLKTLGEVHTVGKRFGVIKFKPTDDTRIFDIALPRKEFSWSFTGGYRDFDIQSDHTLPIDVDLSRRDFTVNAMAYNVFTHELVDPFFGQKDLKAGVIRTVGSATTRFQEDYSRMLRAVRFACRLDFTLSDRTAEAIKRLGNHLDDRIGEEWVVAREVIAQEFLKAFDAAPIRCLQLLDEFNLLQRLLPEVKALQNCQQTPPYHIEGTAFDHLLLALESLGSLDFANIFPEGVSLMSKLAILFHDLGKPHVATKKDGIIHFYGHEQKGAELAKTICDRLKLGSTPFYPFDHDQLAWIVRHHLFAIEHKDSAPKATEIESLFFSQRHPGRALLHCMWADQRASVPAKNSVTITPIQRLLDEIKRLAPAGILPPPLLSGDNVLEWLALQPGPKIAEILLYIREEQLQGRLQSQEQAKQSVLKIYGPK